MLISVRSSRMRNRHAELGQRGREIQVRRVVDGVHAHGACTLHVVHEVVDEDRK